MSDEVDRIIYVRPKLDEDDEILLAKLSAIQMIVNAIPHESYSELILIILIAESVLKQKGGKTDLMYIAMIQSQVKELYAIYKEAVEANEPQTFLNFGLSKK